MKGIEQLYPQNHTLYLRVQTMLNMRCNYEDICDNLGLVGANRVNDLCDWFIAYKSPKALPMVKARPTYAPASYQPVRADAARFIAWRKQHEGAQKALEAIEL